MESKQESQPPQTCASANPNTGSASQGHVLIASHTRIASSAPAATSSVIGSPSAAQAITAPRRLTARQAEILRYIEDFRRDSGYPPTLREIGAAFGITSTNGVNDHLRLIAKKGYLRFSPGKARGMQVTHPVATATRPPKSAADRLRELDLAALSYEQRVLACGELSRIDHAFSAALRYATAVSVETPEPMRRVLRDCAELARQDAQRIAGEVLVRLGVEP